jgi:hypothetical protein
LMISLVLVFPQPRMPDITSVYVVSPGSSLCKPWEDIFTAHLKTYFQYNYSRGELGPHQCISTVVEACTTHVTIDSEELKPAMVISN